MVEFIFPQGNKREGAKLEEALAQAFQCSRVLGEGPSKFLMAAAGKPANGTATLDVQFGIANVVDDTYQIEPRPVRLFLDTNPPLLPAAWGEVAKKMAMFEQRTMVSHAIE